MFQVCGGLNLFYEISGDGAPIILAHGNGEDHTIFDRLIPRLAETHTVYAVDSPGHGRSQQPREFHYSEFAGVFSSFIKELGLERPAFCGFSDGGIIGLLLASAEPGLLSSLTVCGANLTPDGLKGNWRTLFRAARFFTRDPRTEMMLNEPQITENDLKKITVPTLVLAGAKDMVKETETKAIAEGIPGAELKILPGEKHGSYVVHETKLLPLLSEFLKEVPEGIEKEDAGSEV